MKFPVGLSCYVALILAGTAQSSDRFADLERRCAEQERQIAKLELENSRLKADYGSRQTVQPSTPERTIAVEEPKQPEAPASKSLTSEATIHVVKKGETLSGIAKKHGVRTGELAKLNKISNAGMIAIGQKLTLPNSSPALTAQAPEKKVVRGTHKVKKGETFYSIARTYGLSADALSTANPDVNPRALQVGQQLDLVAVQTNSPVPSSELQFPSPIESREQPKGLAGSQTILNQRPTVRRVPITEQITLRNFADKYSMDVARLKRLNGLSDERYQPNTILAEGSALFVSAQPLD